MIPNEWSIQTLGSSKISVIDGDRGSSYPSGSDFIADGYCLFLSAKNVTKVGFAFGECQFISKSKHERLNKGSVIPGDLVLTTRGTVGNIGYFRNLNGFSAIRINSGMAIIRNTGELADTDYLYALFRAPIIERQIEAMTFGSAQPQLTVKIVNDLKLPLPPLPEQRRIAEILSTWDRAIEAMEALIANARTQKTALMQQLFTGKRRLPGFDGEWRETTLAAIADIIVSNVDKKSSGSERSVRLCNYMDVYQSDRIMADMPFMIATASEAQIKRFGLQVGDVLITKDSETPDDIAVPSYVASTSADIVCGYHLAIIRPKRADGQFLKFLLEHPPTHQHFVSRASGATRFGLTVGAIEDAPVFCPGVEEQTLIGEIISAAEIELETLKSKLILLRQEKVALMQQLLTGKRRVVMPESEVV